MTGPFPGMDPWLENPALWPGVHAALIIYIRDQLQPLLRPHYLAMVEERVYVTTLGREMVADVAVRRQPGQRAPQAPLQPESVLSSAGVAAADEPVVVEVVEQELHEPLLQIVDRRHQSEIVSVIEILSPTNKRSGAGREAYLAEQADVLRSTANLVEIDLLRAGQFTLGIPAELVQQAGAYDYLVAITRGHDRRQRSFFYPRFVRQRLPRVALPLRGGDAEVPLDLQALLDRAYEAGDYADQLDYSRPCVSRLRPDDEVWAQERIREWQVRRSGNGSANAPS